jgi:hypothetical protein
MTVEKDSERIARMYTIWQRRCLAALWAVLISMFAARMCSRSSAPIVCPCPSAGMINGGARP